MKKIIPLSIIVAVCLAFSFSDTSPLKILILNKLEKYATERYPEKIYIQTDKPYYTAGENIWFNTYLVNGATNRISEKSNVIYVELINAQDSIISSRKLFTKRISVQGDFKLPIDLKEGNYRLRAYTNYMRNQPREYFFKKEIPVFTLYSDLPNSDISKDNIETVSKEEETTDSLNIGFYPEGGYLVNGLKNKIAVKIKDANLSANSVSGIIEDTKGNKITDFKTSEFGLGSFYLNPQPGVKYRAVIAQGNEDITYPLPNSIIEGYVMNTSITDKEVVINIATNKKEGLKNTLIIGQQRGLAVFNFSQEKSSSKMVVKIPKKNLTEGVLDIVLFNKSTKPVAERLAYINKKTNIAISVKKINGTSIKLRDLVELEIEVKDSLGKLVPSTLSLSITDSELIKWDNDAENIKTYLLLNSDLKGKIKSPNYFFEPGDIEKKNELLDLVMMTHGWRRFVWQDFLEQDILPEFRPEDGIYIKGNTVSTEFPYKNKVSETKLTFRKNGFYQESKKTDSLGHFSYGPFSYNDTINAFLQAGEDISSEKPNFIDTNILFDKRIEKPTVLPHSIKETISIKNINTDKSYSKTTEKSILSSYQFDKGREVLDEVSIKNTPITKEELKNIERVKRARAKFPSYRILVDNMGRHGSGNFMELLEGIPGVRVVRNDTYKAGDYRILFHGFTPIYYLDDRVAFLDDVRYIPQSQIDFIDIIRGGAASSKYSSSGNGIIAIYTIKGDRESIGEALIANGTYNFKSAGFYSAREFYAPDYSSEDLNKNKADIRTTLYWKPNIYANGYDNTTVSFYTSDEKGKFQIEIEGITDSGIPIHQTSFMEVE